MDKNNSLTIKNYKEPLVALEKGKGFGYMGCISGTEDGSEVQCHVCGRLFEGLAIHARIAHNLSANQYREKFGLTRITALVSEKRREILKQKTLEWLASMTPKQKEQLKKKATAGYRKWFKENYKPNYFKIRLETKNKRGTCPDQLLEKIKDVSKDLGRTPSLKEFMEKTGGQKYKHLVFTTFGSWLNALKIAKLVPVVKKQRGKFYSDEFLIETMKGFAHNSNRIPTTSDCKRGLIPGQDLYRRRFGSLAKARVLAGLPYISRVRVQLVSE